MCLLRLHTMGNAVTFISSTANRLVRRFFRGPRSTNTTPAGNSVPCVIHKTVPISELGPGRLIVIGDVHGCHDELQQLLRKVDYQQQDDNLVFVGDLVNKGPKSAQVVTTVRSLCESSHCWCVRGNHDDAALAARRLLNRNSSSPVKPKYQWVVDLQPEDEEFLMDLPFSLTVKGYHVVVVHAGLLPNTPLKDQQLKHMTKMRDVQQTEDGSFIGLEKPAEGSEAWASLWKGPEHVCFGHDAKRRLQTSSYATGLDTGCVYGGRLTACVLPPLRDLNSSTDFLQVQSAAVAAAAAGSCSTAADTTTSSSVQGLTRELLQARLVDVVAARQYEAPGGKSIQALPSDHSMNQQ